MAKGHDTSLTEGGKREGGEKGRRKAALCLYFYFCLYFHLYPGVEGHVAAMH